MTRPTVQPVLMSSDMALLTRLASAPPEAHPAAVAVDWERPDERSTGLDRRPTAAQVAALTAVRDVSPWPVVCRVNEVGPVTEDEVEHAVDLGADEVLVPMVRREVGGRTGPERGPRPVRRRDHGRDPGGGRPGRRRSRARHQPCVRGTARPGCRTRHPVGLHRARRRDDRRLVDALAPTAYGFGGLTDPERGHPLPARLLMGEIVAAGCIFAMMRNAFVDRRGRELSPRSCSRLDPPRAGPLSLRTAARSRRPLGAARAHRGHRRRTAEQGVGA